MSHHFTFRPIIMVFVLLWVGSVFVVSGCDEEEGEKESTTTAVVEGAVAIFPTAEFRTEGFSPEQIDDLEKWAWPEEDDFRVVWESMEGALKAPSIVVGDVHIRPRKPWQHLSGSCPKFWKTFTFSDRILGYYRSADSVRFFATFPSKLETEERPSDHRPGGTITAILPSVENFLENTFQPVDELQTTGEAARYRSECWEMTITPTYLQSGNFIDPDYLRNRTYTTTLLTFGEPVYDPDYPIVRDQWGKHGVRPHSTRELEPEERLEIYRRYKPEPDCGQDAVRERMLADYAELCGELNDTACYAQLSHLMHIYPTFHYRAFPDDFDHYASTPIDPTRFVLGSFLSMPEVQADDVFLYEKNAGDFGAMAMAPWKATTISVHGMARLAAANPEQFVKTLQSWVEDSNLDPYNRLRATRVLYHLGQSSYFERDLLEGLELDHISTTWLETHSRERRMLILLD